MKAEDIEKTICSQLGIEGTNATEYLSGTLSEKMEQYAKEKAVEFRIKSSLVPLDKRKVQKAYDQFKVL